MAKILGISPLYLGRAAAIQCEDEIIAAAQVERFTRNKENESFPKNAVNYSLEGANCTLKDIDHLVFYEKTFLKFDRLNKTYLSFAPKGLESFVKAMP